MCRFIVMCILMPIFALAGPTNSQNEKEAKALEDIKEFNKVADQLEEKFGLQVAKLKMEKGFYLGPFLMNKKTWITPEFESLGDEPNLTHVESRYIHTKQDSYLSIPSGMNAKYQAIGKKHIIYKPIGNDLEYVKDQTKFLKKFMKKMEEKKVLKRFMPAKIIFDYGETNFIHEDTEAGSVHNYWRVVESKTGSDDVVLFEMDPYAIDLFYETNIKNFPLAISMEGTGAKQKYEKKKLENKKKWAQHKTNLELLKKLIHEEVEKLKKLGVSVSFYESEINHHTKLEGLNVYYNEETLKKFLQGLKNLHTNYLAGEEKRNDVIITTGQIASFGLYDRYFDPDTVMLRERGFYYDSTNHDLDEQSVELALKLGNLRLNNNKRLAKITPVVADKKEVKTQKVSDR